jgi:hypothetical protein
VAGPVVYEGAELGGKCGDEGDAIHDGTRWEVITSVNPLRRQEAGGRSGTRDGRAVRAWGGAAVVPFRLLLAHEV